MGTDYKYLVGIRCFTYNQSAYIPDALNGFVSQQTTFPFVIMVVDDASTDGEQDVIKSFIKEIIDTKSTNAVEKKEALFTNLKNECVDIINTLLETSDSDDKDGLTVIIEQLNDMKFCENTLVKDVAKLLELKDIFKS